MRYLVFIIALFAALQTNAQNNIVYGAGINYTNGAPTFTPPVRTSRVAIDTVTGKWYHFNTPGGWQLIGNTIEEIAGCTAPAYTPGKGDSKVVINNCSPQPELYFYNGSAWVLVGGGSFYAGEGIRIENDTIILDSLYILRFRTGSNTDGAAGAMSWNATEETVDLVTDQGAVTGHLMESVYYNTRNTTGAPIPISYVVMANGTTGNTGRILIAPAIADGSVNSEYILGLTAQAIGNNANGKVQHFGKIRSIQTNGSNFGETWVDGDVLYCSAVTPGYLTKVVPTAPNLKVPIAIVIHAHPNNGTLFVRPSHFPDLAQINDVQLSSPTNGQVLTYNSTAQRWENATPANQLQTLSTNGTAGNISISSGNTITLNVNDADASATNELQTLSVAANTATLSNSGGSVTIAGAGINTVGTAGTTITVTGTEVDGSTTNELQTLSTGTNTLTLSNGGGTVTVDTDPASDVTGSGVSGQVSFWTGTQTQSGDNGLFWNNTDKRLGIGTTSPVTGLHVIFPGTGTGGMGTAVFQRSGDNLSAPPIAFRKTRGSAANPTGVQSGDLLGVFDFQGMLPNNANFSTDYAFFGGQVSAAPSGTTLPSSIFFKVGSTASPYNASFYIHHSGRSRFGANSMLSVLPQPNAKLEVIGEGTSSTTWTAQFHNSATGGNNALMVRDDGNVGIGTTTMNGRLNFTDNGSYGLYGSGTSPNYLAGALGIGITAPRTALEVNADQIISTSNVWTSRTNAADNDWRSITYGNGLFVAVSRTGTGNRVMTSPDGINWTIRTSPIDNDWFGIAYGNGLFVAVSFTGTNNKVMTSPDGINWTIRTSASSNEWRSITYGNGLFVAVSASGTNNRVMTSPDGINWTSRTSAANNEWYSVTYGNGLFVAVSATGTGNRVMTSPDGINWTSRTNATENEWVGVTYGNGLFVAVSATGTNNRVMTSPDGINWTSRTSASSNEWRSITYGNGLFVAISRTGTGNRVMTSPDGINWTSRTSATDNDWRSITYGNGLFVAVSATGTGNRVMTSGKVFNTELAHNNIYQGSTRFTGQTIIGTTSQDASSAFEVASTTQGILFPRMTTAQRDLIATPANGLVIYNTSTDKLQVRAAGAWVDLH